MPLLPLLTAEVEGAGAVLHSAPDGRRRVVVCFAGLGSTKEKFSSKVDELTLNAERLKKKLEDEEHKNSEMANHL